MPIKVSEVALIFDQIKSGAPDWAKAWAITESGQAWWFETDKWEMNLQRGGWSSYEIFSTSGKSEKAPNFNYSGDWKESFTLIK